MCRYLLFLVFIISPALADPEDFPPTAFQLAQIRYYVENSEQVDRVVSHGLYQNGYSQNNSAEEIVTIVHDCIGHFYPSISSWKDYVQDLVSQIIDKCPERLWLLSASLKEKGTIDLIVKAIEWEQEALKNKSSILWRAAQLPPEQEKESIIPLSFSLGLFSGFFYDGYVNHNISDCKGSACTYVYWSSQAYGNRLKRGGAGGFYARLRESLPEFFKTHPHYPLVYESSLVPGDILEEAESWYIENKDRRDIFLVLYPEKRMLWGLATGGAVRPLLSLSLYGVEVSNLTLEKIRTESTDEDRFFRRDYEKRGDFLRPTHAIFGQGELFHPKCLFPIDGIVRKIIENESP